MPWMLNLAMGNLYFKLEAGTLLQKESCIGTENISVKAEMLL
jgi:hypothetical protein